MSKRYGILFLIFLFRCILGWGEIREYRRGDQLSVTGNIIKRNQNDTKCIFLIGRFLIEKEGICAGAIGTKIRVTGIIQKGVIDSFLGRLSLISAKIDQTEKDSRNQEFENSRSGWMVYFRENLISVYKTFLPEPEAGLVAGIILGYKKDIGREFYQEMVKSGSVHIAVASGYNVLLVGGVILSLSFWLFKRREATLVALGVMVFYAVLAGGDPPVIRAVWMAGFIYFAQLIGRASLSAWILALTATVMFIFEPTLLTDPSFQLSIAASLGLIVLEPWLTKKLKGWTDERLIEAIANLGIMTTVATMMTTAPVLWFQFGRMSLIGLVSNILILPVVPPIMMLGSGMLLLPGLFSGPVYALAHFLVMVIKFFGT